MIGTSGKMGSLSKIGNLAKSGNVDIFDKIGQICSLRNFEVPTILDNPCKIGKIGKNGIIGKSGNLGNLTNFGNFGVSHFPAIHFFSAISAIMINSASSANWATSTVLASWQFREHHLCQIFRQPRQSRKSR